MGLSRPFDPKVLALGRRLVAHLQEEGRDDSLSAWMAHHIAGLMIAVESATSLSDRELLEARCMDAILQLWDHRGALPGKSAPFAKVQEALDFLIRIDPHSTENLFFRMRSSTRPDGLHSDWLERAELVDGAARVLIRHCLEEAFKGDAAEFRVWVELAPQIDDHVPQSDVALAAALAGLFDKDEGELKARVEERLIASIDVMLAELTTLRGGLSRTSGDDSNE